MSALLYQINQLVKDGHEITFREMFIDGIKAYDNQIRIDILKRGKLIRDGEDYEWSQIVSTDEKHWPGDRIESAVVDCLIQGREQIFETMRQKNG